MILYQFKCTDADEDGIFTNTPWGKIDTTEFAQFIESMEKHPITKQELIQRHDPSKDIMKLVNRIPKKWLEIYDDGQWVVIFDGDIHYIYRIS